MANLKISDLTAAVSANGTQLFEVSDSGTTYKLTGAQLLAYIQGNLTLSNISDVTATAAELNKLDGMTATTLELNYVDGVTSAIQTQLDSKAAASGGTITSPTITTPVITSPDIDLGSDATGDILYRNSGGSISRLGIGSTDQVLTVASGLPSWADAAGGAALDTQTFTSSGTWTKPSEGNIAMIWVWGGGGGGGMSNSAQGGGGGGGGCSIVTIPLSLLGSTETVTIGAGGSARGSYGNGGNGGNSTFGSWVTGYGGKGGNGRNGSSGYTGIGGDSYITLASADTAPGIKGLGGISATDIHPGIWSGGSGNAGSYFGGAGGSNSATTYTSTFGGDGGRSPGYNQVGTAGSVPGGGGGGGQNTTSGAGASGQVTVYVF